MLTVLLNLLKLSNPASTAISVVGNGLVWVGSLIRRLAQSTLFWGILLSSAVWWVVGDLQKDVRQKEKEIAEMISINANHEASIIKLQKELKTSNESAQSLLNRLMLLDSEKKGIENEYSEFVKKAASMDKYVSKEAESRGDCDLSDAAIRLQHDAVDKAN